jgi:hypothetical protein
MGAGYAVFEFDDSSGDLEGGELYLGTTSQTNANVTAESVEIPDEDPPVEETLLEVASKVVRTFQLTVKNMSWEIQQAFFIAVKNQISQASGSVTDDDKTVMKPGYSYQLGTHLNTTGVRGVSAVAVSSREGRNAIAWAASTAKVIGNAVIPTAGNNHWYMAVVTGDTGTSEPTWPTDGSTVVDGGVTWQDMGVIDYSLTTDFTYSATDGRVFMTTTGVYAAAWALADAVGVKIGISCDYSHEANTRDQLVSGGVAVTGALRIIAENTEGENRDFYLPKVTLVPNGDFAMKSRTEAQVVAFDVKPSKRGSLEQLYIDGQAA